MGQKTSNSTKKPHTQQLVLKGQKTKKFFTL